MIKTIIFDFGNVFINLDLEGAMQKALERFEIKAFPNAIIETNIRYEQGLISTNDFLNVYEYTFPKLSKPEIIDLWNGMLKDFPEYRLNFLKQIVGLNRYKLILLSNTNELHINWVIDHIPFYKNFKDCFHAFYLSHEIHLRKPSIDIFKHVLNENNLISQESLFIDDTFENITTARKLGMYTWHINPKTEDVTNLFKLNKHLF